jgi:SagB-type dehydrogenase family enzyme
MSTKEVYAYHQRTKHQLHAYARGPEYLDWDDQPDPFRRFDGTQLIELPFLNAHQSSQGTFGLNQIGTLLELSMGLSAWKQYGPDRWALRCNPSSGNLHPTEAYIVSRGIKGLENAVYHYAPHEHALELRGQIISGVATTQCLIGLSSIAWREAWKYGERAFRYVQLDIGHALAAVRYAAEAVGVRLSLLETDDDAISGLLGLDRSEDFANAEREMPDLLLSLQIPGQERSPDLPRVESWQGLANSLGGEPKHQWPLIGEITLATHATEPIEHNPNLTESWPNPISEPFENPELIQIIRQRRSAQAYSGKQSMLSQDDFYTMIDALLPRQNSIPWDIWPWPARLHPVFFVHRVGGLSPGIYFLPRSDKGVDFFKQHLSSDFVWEKPGGCPDQLPFYCLMQGDTRKTARALSCHQEIASASSFSLGMLAEFDSGLQAGSAVYRHLYWEAGMLGQVLYLRAESVGFRGTGIGCFFDDAVHELLGIKDTTLQSLYHFTVGSPREDLRLQTLPPYTHLDQARFT